MTKMSPDSSSILSASDETVTSSAQKQDKRQRACLWFYLGYAARCLRFLELHRHGDTPGTQQAVQEEYGCSRISRRSHGGDERYT